MGRHNRSVPSTPQFLAKLARLPPKIKEEACCRSLHSSACMASLSAHDTKAYGHPAETTHIFASSEGRRQQSVAFHPSW